MEMVDARIPYEKCPLCHAKDPTVELTADCSRHPLYKIQLPETQRWLRCRACDHSYVDGYFSPDALDILFSSGHSYQTPGQEIENTRYISASMVENVCGELGSPTGRWLDIGFGNGALMTTAAEFGFDTVGLDLRIANVEMMRKFGFEVYPTELENYTADEPFDAISMADVLEHMPFPKSALEHAGTLLRDAGVLFVSMPNSDSFLWSFLTRNETNPYWGEIEHYHNFGRKRFYALLHECGFEPVRYGVSKRYRVGMEVIAKKKSSES